MRPIPSVSAEVLSIILAGGRGERLRPITERRAKPAVPFGGNYRIIDFALSNCVNSNLRRIIVLTQYESLELQRHIRKAWNILSPELDEFITLLPPQQRLPGRWYAGTADAIFQNLYVLQQERPRWVLVLGGDHIYKMNYRALLEEHRSAGAGATIVCIDVDPAQARGLGVMQVADTNRVVGFEEKPDDPQPIPDRPDRCLASMGIYIFDTDVLVRALIADAKAAGSEHDFGKNVIPRLISERHVHAYRFSNPDQPGDGYWRDVGTRDSYWQANMDLLARHPEFDLYDDSWPLRSGVGSRPPAKVCVSTEGTMGVVEQSLVAAGSVISGGHIRRCVLGPRVEVHNGSALEECVVMGGAYIGKYVRLRRAIVEERTIVPDGAVIGYDAEADRQRFVVTTEGVVIVPRGAPLDPPESAP